MLHLVVLEDDHLQEERIVDHLRATFAGVRILALRTEEEFRAQLPAMRADVPDLMVVDVMLRWTDPRPGMPAQPEDVEAGGYYRAGQRCTQLLLEDPVLRAVPVVLFTILERSDLERDGQRLPANASYMGKNDELDTLVRHIRDCLRRRASGIEV